MRYKFIKNHSLDKELRALYEEKGQLPDMSHLERTRHRRTTRILFTLVIFLAFLTAASWAGFFLFNTSSGGGEVNLRFGGPETVTSGIAQEITLRYQNLDRHPLAFATLRLHVPENLYIEETDPQPREAGRFEWEFGTLAAKSAGEVKLKVIPYGFPDQTLDLTSTFSYKPANFNAEFQTSKTHTFTINESAIDIMLEGPAEASPGQQLSFQARVENTTEDAFETIRVSPVFPATFSPSITETDPKTEDPIWDFNDFKPGEPKEINFKGSFLSNTEGAQEIALQIETVKQGKNYPLAKYVHTVDILNPDLDIELLVNENPAQPWVRIGQILNINLKLANRSDKPFENLKAALHLAGDSIDLAKIQAENALIKEGIIVFPKEGDITLEAQATREFKSTLPLISPGGHAVSPFINIEGEVIYGDTKVRTPPLKLIVVSDMDLSTEVRYFAADGTPVGAGPLPPRVGEETRFKIRFRIKNSFHDLSNIVVSANLPETVRWTDSTDLQAGRISFDAAKREVRWEIPRMPVTTQELTASFEVGITPESADQGQLLLLVGIARVEALDTVSQITFSTDTPSASSVLASDPFGKGKGVVE